MLNEPRGLSQHESCGLDKDGIDRPDWLKTLVAPGQTVPVSDLPRERATKSSPDRSAPSSSASAVSVRATNFRDTADLLVDVAVSVTALPTGSRPRP